MVSRLNSYHLESTKGYFQDVRQYCINVAIEVRRKPRNIDLDPHLVVSWLVARTMLQVGTNNTARGSNKSLEFAPQVRGFSNGTLPLYMQHNAKSFPLLNRVGAANPESRRRSGER